MGELAPVVAKATAELDRDTLEQLLEAEQDTHNRADMVSLIEANLATLEAIDGNSSPTPPAA
jgi:hypothetical protein